MSRHFKAKWFLDETPSMSVTPSTTSEGNPRSASSVEAEKAIIEEKNRDLKWQEMKP
jgi:hypothetical protein